MKKFLTNPRYFWPIVALVFIIARVATWGYPYDSDHWIFYYVGKIWAQGGTMYVAAWDHKPPLIFVFNGLMSLLFGANIIWHRVWLTLLSIVDIVLFWQLIKRILPEIKVKHADIAAKVGLLLYVFWRNLSQFTSSGNNTENYGLVFFLGMLLSYLSFRKDQKWWKILISGTCFSVLFFLKGNFLLLGVPIGILLLVDNWKSIRKFFGYGIVFVVPLVLQVGFWSYYFNSKSAFNDFFIASFQFSAKYAKSAWSGDVSNNIVLLLTLLLFLLPMLLYFAVYLKDAKVNLKNHDYLLVGLTFLAGLGLTIGVGSFYPYYFLIFMPISVIIMVYALFNTDLNKYLRILLYLALGGSMILSYGVSVKQLYNSFAGSVRAEAQEYRDIAAYVNANTEASDKVFAYDYGASFYALSNRDSGSRFVSASVLLLENRDNYGFDFDQKFIGDMEKSQAKYVVVYRDRESLYYQNKPIIDYFDTHYLLDKTFTKFEVLKRRASESEVMVVRDCTFNEQGVLSMMNDVRSNDLSIDSYLDGVAQKRADTMPYELDNHSGFRILTTNGSLLGYVSVNEILASNDKCPSTNNIFTQWKLSPSHWSAITNERYDALGIGFNGQSAVVIFGDLM